MLMTLAFGLAVGVSMQQTDTTFAVDPGARLDLKSYAGEVFVQTWDRNEIRLIANHSRREEILIESTGERVRVRSSLWDVDADEFRVDIESGEMDGSIRSVIGTALRSAAVGLRFAGRPPSIISYDLTVPRGMELDLAGPYIDVDVEGAGGNVTAETFEGEIRVRGGDGNILLRSIEGSIELADARGRVRVIAVDGSITLDGVSGAVTAEGFDGDVELWGIESEEVEISTIDGDIIYDGSIVDRGWYSFVTHDGDVTLGIADGTSATFAIATFDGDVRATIPIDLPQRRRRRVTARIGDGSARVEIEAFDGEISLLRPSQVRSARRD